MIAVKHHRHWIIALLVLAFLGQSLAVVAMPCQLMEKSAPDMHNMVGMDHSMMGMHHDMSKMAMPDQSPDKPKLHDCCKTMGHCSPSSCALLALSYSLLIGTVAGSSMIVDSYNSQSPNTPIASLYRPPIFR